MTKSKIIENNISELKKSKIFDKSVAYTNRQYRPYDAAWYLYRELIEIHKNPGLQKIITNPSEKERFYELIYATLGAFNMNQRRARMVEFHIFKKRLNSIMPTILRLYPYKLVSLDENSLESVLNQLKKIFHLLDIMKSSSHLVAISKTLHFLLPKLVVPIDRTYTLQFFYGTNKYYKERKREWELFKEIFIKSSEIAKSVQYKNNVDATIPKLIDDAIIGFVKQENSPTKMGQSDP